MPEPQCIVEVQSADFHDDPMTIHDPIGSMTETHPTISSNAQFPIQLSNGATDIGRIFAESDLMKYYTGFHNCAHFMLLFNILGPSCHFLKFKSRLGPQNELLATLMKLRHAKDDFELAIFFGVGRSTMSNVIATWINFLYFQLREIDVWPSRKIVDQHCPKDIKIKFPHVRTILDATEVGMERPKNAGMQCASFSTYKNKNTAKCMIGISTRGLVTYISDAYGGNTSDRQIVERSDLTSKFDRGDCIMVDRGITVQDLFAPADVKVLMPSFLRGRDCFDQSEIFSDRCIASKRIHVERVIGHAKRFKILQHEMGHSKRILSGRIIFICFSLINLFPAIVDESS